MLKNDAFILTLAYPEGVVSHAEEWYSKFLRFLFIGNKQQVRAGHAALVLIDKATGILEYHDFGRYITPSPDGRVRGRETDFELNFPIKALVKNNSITNLDTVLGFLATHPKLTHGDGHLYASVCKSVNYNLARKHINYMQSQGFIPYAAFKKEACNCARFVTDALIASVTDKAIVLKLKNAKRFTPSTLANVVAADTENNIQKISESGVIRSFNSSVSKENRRLFLDTLDTYKPSVIGTTQPMCNASTADHAQWLSGIAAGAWFELYDLDATQTYRFRRISPHGHIDCDGVYKISSEGFDINTAYKFVHYSNCLFFHIEQKTQRYRFDFVTHYSV